MLWWVVIGELGGKDLMYICEGVVRDGRGRQREVDFFLIS